MGRRAVNLVDLCHLQSCFADELKRYCHRRAQTGAFSASVGSLTSELGVSPAGLLCRAGERPPCPQSAPRTPYPKGWALLGTGIAKLALDNEVQT